MLKNFFIKFHWVLSVSWNSSTKTHLNLSWILDRVILLLISESKNVIDFIYDISNDDLYLNIFTLKIYLKKLINII